MLGCGGGLILIKLGGKTHLNMLELSSEAPLKLLNLGSAVCLIPVHMILDGVELVITNQDELLNLCPKRTNFFRKIHLAA